MHPVQVFRRFGKWTIIAVYVLILVGGVVRATGAGMGCPDWPKCFGSWVPPTRVEQLPANYQEIFGKKLRGEVVFNATKTWTEYINRLVGVLIGIFIFLTFVMSIRAYWHTDRTIVWLSLAAFLLVGYEGWLGAKVVSSELLPVMVTVHMLLAVVIVFILIYALMRSYSTEKNAVNGQSQIQFLTWLAMGFSFGQLFLGTQIREVVDVLIIKYNREFPDAWFTEIGGKFYFHIAISVVLFVLHFYLRQAAGRSGNSGVIKIGNYLFWIVTAEIITGALLGFLKLPALLQPLHLTFGVLVLGLQFILGLMVSNKFSMKSTSVLG